jgi:hypothetical protein
MGCHGRLADKTLLVRATGSAGQVIRRKFGVSYDTRKGSNIPIGLFVRKEGCKRNNSGSEPQHRTAAATMQSKHIARHHFASKLSQAFGWPGPRMGRRRIVSILRVILVV